MPRDLRQIEYVFDNMRHETPTYEALPRFIKTLTEQELEDPKVLEWLWAAQEDAIDEFNDVIHEHIPRKGALEKYLNFKGIES